MGIRNNARERGDDGEDEGKGRKCNNSFEGFADLCSICLEAVAYDANRSCAKLSCGHQFHLDCIGSAFNAKGAMQCPNCRKIENGDWLYGHNPLQGSSTDEWVPEEDNFGVAYSEMFGVHWCPYGNISPFHQIFEEEQIPSNTYHEHPSHLPSQLPSQHPPHPCPYFPYVAPVYHPLPSRASSSSFGPSWSDVLDFPASYSVPPMDLPYHGWEPQSPINDRPSIPSPPRPEMTGADPSIPVPLLHLALTDASYQQVPRNRRSPNTSGLDLRLGPPSLYEQNENFCGSGGRGSRSEQYSFNHQLP